MKITVVLLLVSSVLADKRRQQPTDQTPENSGKRALVDGNAGVEKRAPVLPTVLPSVTPGIEYAATKGPSKTATQEDYADGLPESLRPAVAKISDLLAGQGASFSAAISNHLVAPISAYQPRLVNPTTYEVSAPVASQLAYSEHKISYQPAQFKQNAKAYQPFQPLVPPEQVVYSHPGTAHRQNYHHQINHNEILQRQFGQQQNLHNQIRQQQNYQNQIGQQQILNQYGQQQLYQQQIVQQPRFTFNHVPQAEPLQYNQPIIYSNTQLRNPAPHLNYVTQQHNPQSLQVPQNQYHLQNTRTFFPQLPTVYQGIPQQIFPQGTGIPSVEIVQSLEPGITYAKQEDRPQPPQGELKTTAAPIKLEEKPLLNQQQGHINPQQGAVSYASFSVGPGSVNYIPHPAAQPAPASQPNVYQQPGPGVVPTYQPLQIGVVVPQQFQQQYQTQQQYQALIPRLEQEISNSIEQQNTRSLPQSPRISYFRPGLSLYRNFYTPEAFAQPQSLVLQNPSVPSQGLTPISLPGVQFYGKYAHSIFGQQYQQQQEQQQQQQQQKIDQQPQQQQDPQPQQYKH